MITFPAGVVYIFCPNDPVDNVSGKKVVVDGIRMDTPPLARVIYLVPLFLILHALLSIVGAIFRGFNDFQVISIFSGVTTSFLFLLVVVFLGVSRDTVILSNVAIGLIGASWLRALAAVVALAGKLRDLSIRKTNCTPPILAAA